MKNIFKRRKSFRSGSGRLTAVTLSVLFTVTVYKIITIDTEGINMKTAFADFFQYAKLVFLRPAVSSKDALPDMFFSLAVTIGLAVQTTVISVITALILAPAAASNLSVPAVIQTVRAFIAFIRAVPTIIWVLIFSVTTGLGAEAAILGMSFHGSAYLTKVFSESFEQIDKRTIEALRSCGAGYFAVLTQAVIPASLNKLISWSFFRFEINFGNAVAAGAAAGAGGIGYHLFMAGCMYFNMRETGFISYMIFVSAIILELSSNKLRDKLRTG